MEGQSGLSELSVISWVSAFQGYPLSGVPLYIVKCRSSHELIKVLNSILLAECAEFSSIVIELVIGILLSPPNNYMPFVQLYKLHQSIAVK